MELSNRISRLTKWELDVKARKGIDDNCLQASVVNFESTPDHSD